MTDDPFGPVDVAAMDRVVDALSELPCDCPDGDPVSDRCALVSELALLWYDNARNELLDLRGAAGVPEQAGRTETLIEHHESTLRGALMMARARYELAQEEFDRAAAEGRSVDTPRPRRQRPDRPRVVPRSWPAEFRPVYDDDFDSPSLPVVPPTPETQQ